MSLLFFSNQFRIISKPVRNAFEVGYYNFFWKLYFCITFAIFVFSTELSAISVYHMLGYNFKKNESYVDTVDNKEIYWNPNSGFSMFFGIRDFFAKTFEWRVEFSGTFGYYQYDTTDGRKVNTEAAAENVPPTKNVEWSQIFSIVPSIGQRYNFSKIAFTFGVGLGPYFSRSYETWDFGNVDGQDAHLEIKKYYPITIGFIGRGGIEYKVSNNINIICEFQFEAVNFVMSQVDLTSYTLDGEEQIDNYTRSQVTYVYARDIPDENKGGEALLAGFNFANYPQEKIGTVMTLKLGVSYKF
jgi:hypothetical protein